MAQKAHGLTFVLLDDDWRPVDRLPADVGWRALIGRMLELDSHWLVIEQYRHHTLPTSPLSPDIALSRAYRRRLRPLNIDLVDHIIHGPGESMSFRAAGLL